MTPPPPTMDRWELTARERIRDSLARYTWSGDSLRLDELVLAFTDDGVLELRGQPPIEGRDAIVAFLGGVASQADDLVPPAAATAGRRRIVRHNVANVEFLEVTPTRAQVSSYFTVLTEIGLDHYGRYRDTFVPVGPQWLIRHRFVSTDWRSPESTMAPPSSIS